MKPRIDELNNIYASFDAQTAGYRSQAACARGCTFCCTGAGSIDIVTLEGWSIREHVERMPRMRRTAIRKALARDMKKREAGSVSACPFLMKTASCMIYPLRPFACRRIHSRHTCSPSAPPQLHRRVMELSGQAITALQRLDENGYSGHISFILHMLDSPRFLATYLAGEFRPAEVMVFGQTHGIVINRMVAGPSGSPQPGELKR